jgi:hypothetical protein
MVRKRGERGGDGLTGIMIALPGLVSLTCVWYGSYAEKVRGSKWVKNIDILTLFESLTRALRKTQHGKEP